MSRRRFFDYNFFYCLCSLKGNLLCDNWNSHKSADDFSCRLWYDSVYTGIFVTTCRHNPKYHLPPCFSIYFNSWKPKKATKLTEEFPPVHNKSNITLNTSICLTFMYITCKISTANLKLIDNLIVSPDTSTLRRLLLSWLQNQQASGLK